MKGPGSILAPGKRGRTPGGRPQAWQLHALGLCLPDRIPYRSLGSCFCLALLLLLPHPGVLPPLGLTHMLVSSTVWNCSKNPGGSQDPQVLFPDPPTPAQ
jgi:hypothetical protein